LSEQEFWTKYCRAEYLLRTKNTLRAKAEAADDEELAMFLKNDDILAKEAKLKVYFKLFIGVILHILQCFVP
jgi:transcription initiation factor TFIIH subunit 1